MKNIKNKFLFNSIFLLAIFILAIGVWHSPILFKGYNPHGPSIGSLLVRNLSESGLYQMEDNLNVVLSSNLIEDNGNLAVRGNKLTPLLFSKIFSITGLSEANDLIFLSIFICALTLLIFTVIVFYLFNFKTALFFSIIYIFLPFNWQLPYGFCAYEFTLLFLSLFFLLFFYGLKHKYDYIYLSISSIFLALACLSKEALLLIIPFLFLFLWFKKQRKCLLYVFIPFVIIFAIFWLPGIKNNSYLQLFTTNAPEENKSADFAFYSHVYPDPYTYHFEQNEYLKSLQDQVFENRLDLMEKLSISKVLTNMSIQGIGFIDRIKVGFMLGSRHIFRFVSLEDIGGPFIFLLILLGLYNLRKKNKYLYQFFIYWIPSTVFLMSFVILAGRDHLADFNWAITLLISLGLIFLAKLINDYFDLKKKKQILLYIVLLSVVTYHLVLVNHVAWSRIYDNSDNLMNQAYGQEIKKLNIADSDVIAVNLAPGTMYSLNYLTNKSMVVFKSETINSLLEENKLKWAFEQFGVKYILGYSDELSKNIVSQVDVVNIASNSLEPAVPEMSRNKGWLMNLIK